VHFATVARLEIGYSVRSLAGLDAEEVGLLGRLIPWVMDCPSGSLGARATAVPPSATQRVFEVLSGADGLFTSWQAHRLARVATHQTCAGPLDRLAEHGLATVEPVGRANLYRLNPGASGACAADGSGRAQDEPAATAGGDAADLMTSGLAR
jgi:hypothetical protein